MDMRIRHSGLVLRIALGLICLISFAVAALLVISTVADLYTRYSPPPPSPFEHVFDGPSYEPLSTWQWLDRVLAFLFLGSMMLSAIALWWRFRVFAAIVAGFTLAFALLFVSDTVLGYLHHGGQYVPLFYSIVRELIVLAWAAFVLFILWRIDRKPGAAA